MTKDLLEKKFKDMGARINVRTPTVRQDVRGNFAIDIARDGEGECFDLLVRGDNVRFQVLDVQKKDRHLLLAAFEDGERDGIRPSVQKFLCGHDERHWFVAGVPERSSTVDAAKQALKPAAVVSSQQKQGVRHKNRHKRSNKGFIRQGEWFFIPAPNLSVDAKLILKKEPLQRGRGKPHMAEELYRTGGQTVHVHSVHAPNGVTPAQFGRLSNKTRSDGGWRIMSRNPMAYVRGKVRHSDHKTIELKFWHQVVPNNETGSRNVAFLD